MLKNYVIELFSTPPRSKIPNFDEQIMLDDFVRISRKSIKYIIDSRKEDDYSLEKILTMLERAPQVIRNYQMRIPNTNKSYPNSFISVRLYREEKSALMVIHQLNGEINDIYNSYYRKEKEFLNKYGVLINEK